MKQTVSILLRNQEAALFRLMGVFYRRGYLIEGLSMAPEDQDHVRISASVSCSGPESSQLLRHLANLIDVIAVEVLPNDATPERYMSANQIA